MSPIRTTSLAAEGDLYASPFVGPIDHVVAIDCNIANLTAYEVDSDGVLKPGVPLTAAGALVAALARSTVAAGVLANGNANGTIGTATGGFGGPTETITVTMTGTGATAAFNVYGSKSGYLGTGAVGTTFDSEAISFLISDGSTDWEAGDVVTYAVTAGASDKVYGVTVEATKLVANNGAARTGTFQVAVATVGLVNRDVVEDILGRTLTAAEIAGFATGALKLTNT